MIKVLLVLSLLFSLSFSQEFAKKFGYETNYKTAVKKAKEEKKDIVFVLVSSYCPWCDQLKEEELSLEYTNEMVHKYYIPLMLYSDYDDFPSKFNSYVVPTIYFVNYKDESIQEKIVGYNNNYRFYEIIDEIKKLKK